MLVVDKIHVYYGDLHILKDVSFTINANEIFALVGANGAGKSTSIRTISGILKNTKGQILFNGERIDVLHAHEIVNKGIIHVPEGRRLFPEMTVEENLYMGSLCEEAKNKRNQTLEYVYSLFPIIKQRRSQLAGTLSGGEQQMVAVGRGLMGLPKLMMFDEPSLGLAPIIVQELMNLIKKVNQEGVTVLVVEQNVNQTLAMCDRACIIENGSIVLHGTGKDLLADPHVKTAYLGL